MCFDQIDNKYVILFPTIASHEFGLNVTRSSGMHHTHGAFVRCHEIFMRWHRQFPFQRSNCIWITRMESLRNTNMMIQISFDKLSALKRYAYAYIIHTYAVSWLDKMQYLLAYWYGAQLLSSCSFRRLFLCAGRRKWRCVECTWVGDFPLVAGSTLPARENWNFAWVAVRVHVHYLTTTHTQYYHRAHTLSELLSFCVSLFFSLFEREKEKEHNNFFCCFLVSSHCSLWCDSSVDFVRIRMLCLLTKLMQIHGASSVYITDDRVVLQLFLCIFFLFCSERVDCAKAN